MTFLVLCCIFSNPLALVGCCWLLSCLPSVYCGCSLSMFLLLLCTMPKRQAVVIFPEVNYELSLVMENVKRESWRQSTSSPK
jgi:hypothetical protein